MKKYFISLPSGEAKFITASFNPPHNHRRVRAYLALMRFPGGLSAAGIGRHAGIGLGSVRAALPKWRRIKYVSRSWGDRCYNYKLLAPAAWWLARWRSEWSQYPELLELAQKLGVWEHVTRLSGILELKELAGQDRREQRLMRKQRDFQRELSQHPELESLGVV